VGCQMTREQMAFVSFDPTGKGFTALLSMADALRTELDMEGMMSRAAAAYDSAVSTMLGVCSEIEAFRARRALIPARKVWLLGDTIFRLRNELASLSLQMDDLYRHLSRDLGVKRKWLEKVIIFRRHVPDIALVPVGLNWGPCTRGTRRVGEALTRGHCGRDEDVRPGQLS